MEGSLLRHLLHRRTCDDRRREAGMREGCYPLRRLFGDISSVNILFSASQKRNNCRQSCRHRSRNRQSDSPHFEGAMAGNLLLETLSRKFSESCEEGSIDSQSQNKKRVRESKDVALKRVCVTKNGKGKLGKKRPYHKAKRGVSPGNHVNILGCKAGKSGWTILPIPLLEHTHSIPS